MYDLETPACSICGRYKQAHDRWFLLVESTADDCLRILEWHEELAKQEDVPRACCIAHVQELVVHWMALGSLHHPFAASTAGPPPTRPETAGEAANLFQGQTIGELSVHRESIRRVLNDDPQSLRSILDALVDALQLPAEEDACEWQPRLPIMPAVS